MYYNWLIYLAYFMLTPTQSSAISYLKRNNDLRYANSDIPEWRQRACQKTQREKINLHYVCDERGNVKCLPGWQGDLCQVPLCRKGCDPMNGYCQRPDECRCRIGYTGEFCERCIPLPGCQHGYCNKPFECICKPGWDGLFCTEPTCRSGCHNTRGYCEAPGECRCRIGWAGRTCSDCAVLPGCQHGTCQKPLECNCLPGYTGLLCQTAICATGCHKQRGYCAKPGECRCKVGWTGPNCDLCFAYPGCVNGNCNRPWECNCKSGWGGMLCDEKLTYCDEHPNTCKNGGNCISYTKDDGNYRCECKHGYFGKRCEILDEFMLTSTSAPRITPPPMPERDIEQENNGDYENDGNGDDGADDDDDDDDDNDVDDDNDIDDKRTDNENIVGGVNNNTNTFNSSKFNEEQQETKMLQNKTRPIDLKIQLSSASQLQNETKKPNSNSNVVTHLSLNANTEKNILTTKKLIEIKMKNETSKNEFANLNNATTFALKLHVTNDKHLLQNLSNFMDNNNTTTTSTTTNNIPTTTISPLTSFATPQPISIHNNESIRINNKFKQRIAAVERPNSSSAAVSTNVNFANEVANIDEYVGGFDAIDNDDEDEDDDDDDDDDGDEDEDDADEDDEDGDGEYDEDQLIPDVLLNNVA